MSTVNSHMSGGPNRGVPMTDDSAFLRKFQQPTEPFALDHPESGRRFVLTTMGKILALFLCAAGLFGLVYHARTTSLFRLQHVGLSGFRYTDTREVLSLIQTAYTDNLMTLDVDHLRRSIEKFRWVQSATVRKVFPNRLVVHVVERAPAGVARSSRLWLFDETGNFLDECRGNQQLPDRPILVGVKDPADAQAADDNQDRVRIYLDVLREIDRNQSGFSIKISEVDMTDIADVVVVPNDAGPRVHLGSSDYQNRLRRYFDIIQRAREENGEIAEVDMRYEDRIVVKPL